MVPKTSDPDWIVEPEMTTEICCGFIRETLAAAGAAGVVIGLSGGIDSAVAAALAVRALGAESVLGVFMPYRTSHPDSLSDAKAVAEHLGIESEYHEITDMADSFLAGIPEDALLRRGNVMARCRMIMLYDLSARDGRLVLGTGNRTETLLGYATLHGDAAFALNPLGDLYKAKVRLLARHLELPEIVLTKAPSADLWEDQTDEGELGFTYAEADRLLHHMIDDDLGDQQLVSLGYDKNLVSEVRRRVLAQAFKWLPVPYAVVAERPLPNLDALRKRV